MQRYQPNEGCCIAARNIFDAELCLRQIEESNDRGNQILMLPKISGAYVKSFISGKVEMTTNRDDAKTLFPQEILMLQRMCHRSGMQIEIESSPAIIATFKCN